MSELDVIFNPQEIVAAALQPVLGVTLETPVGREIIQGTRFEIGTHNQRSAATSAAVYFNEQHSKPPVFWAAFDKRQNPSYQVDTYYGFTFVDYEQLLGFPLLIQKENSATHSSKVVRYGKLTYYATGSNSQYLYYVTEGAVSLSEKTTSGSASVYENRYYTTNTLFRLRSNSSSKYLRSGQAFNWFAVWMPE